MNELRARCHEDHVLKSTTDVVRQCEVDEKAPGSRFTPEHIRSCVERIEKVGCNLRSEDFACGPPAGLLPNGATCFSDAQCASTSCNGAATGCGRCGTREVYKPKESPVGAPCGLSFKEAVDRDLPEQPPCAEGSYCGEQRRCVAYARGGS